MINIFLDIYTENKVTKVSKTAFSLLTFLFMHHDCYDSFHSFPQPAAGEKKLFGYKLYCNTLEINIIHDYNKYFKSEDPQL